MCTEEFRRNNPVRFEQSDAAREGDRISLSQSEEESVAEKLRSLGYM